MKKRLQNFWYYYKVPVIIVLILLAVGLYFLLQPKTPPADYDAAIVSPRGLSDEQLNSIRSVLEQAGEDQNGDGAVVINIHVYRFAIGADGQDRIEISRLDADLVGKVSGIFFTEDPEGFETMTNGIGKAADAVPISSLSLFSGCGIDDLYIIPRKNADSRYAALWAALTE